MKERIVHLNSTVCYLKKDNRILMIKFNKIVAYINILSEIYVLDKQKFKYNELIS